MMRIMSLFWRPIRDPPNEQICLLTGAVEGYTLNICYILYIYIMSCTFLIGKTLTRAQGFNTNWKGNSWCSIFHAIGSTFSPTQDDFSSPPEFISVSSCHRFGNPKTKPPKCHLASWHPGWGVDPSHFSFTPGSHPGKIVSNSYWARWKGQFLQLGIPQKVCSLPFIFWLQFTN